MTKTVKIIVNFGTREAFTLEVEPGDRVDSLGNVWNSQGTWTRGPGSPTGGLPNIDPLSDASTPDDIDPMFDDPLPENMGGPSREETFEQFLAYRRDKFVADKAEAEAFGDDDDDLSEHTMEGLRERGWLPLLDAKGTWIRPKGKHGPYARSGTASWFATLNLIQVSAKKEAENYHGERIETEAVAMITAIKAYRRSLDDAEAEGFTVSLDLGEIING